MSTQIWAEPTAALSYSTSHALLIKALSELSYWQSQKNRHGCGRITLDRALNHWAITVSLDLSSKVIPF